MPPVRVILVEDDPSLALTLQTMLSEEGFRVVGRAKNGEEAVALAIQETPDAILMDISLEGEMDGVDAADSIQQMFDLPIIYMTGYDDSETVERALKTNPFGYLIKPFSKRELSVTLRMALYKNEVDRHLRESELRLATILANIPDGVIHTDENGNVVYLNPLAEVFTQCAREKVIGQTLTETLKLTSTQDSSPPLSSTEILEKRSSLANPVCLHAPDGQQRIVEAATTPIRDTAGEVRGYVITLRDVTDAFHAEQRVRTLGAALENLEDAVLITSPDFPAEGPAIDFANDAFERMTGWRRGEVYGKPISVLLRPSEDEGFLGFLRSSLEQGRPFQGESMALNRNGDEFHSQWLATTVSPMAGTEGRLVFIIRDVTHVRRLEENIRQSQKIEAVGRLAGGIAHDFNNILSVINSYSDLQILKLDEEHPAMKYARQIRSAGKKGADLVAQLMTFSRRDKPDPAVLDLAEVVTDIKGMLRRVIRENVTLETYFEIDVGRVRADQGQIEQALLNICVNARDAMPNGGSIEISLRPLTMVEPRTGEGVVLRPGEYTVLAIKDSGCGMDDATRRHIFEPFFTTKEIGKGTGLGLSTVYGIMKQLGGSIEVQSVIGEGTTFELYFPVVTESKSQAKTEELVDAPQEGSESILVVEDDETFLDCVSGLLTLHGYVVHTATDGEEALAYLKDHATEIRLLISDLVLPHVSGREIAQYLCEQNPEARLIFMTGYDDQLDSAGELPESSVLLEKPFPLNSLLLRVREVLDEAQKEVDASM